MIVLAVTEFLLDITLLGYYGIPIVLAVNEFCRVLPNVMMLRDYLWM